MKKKNVQALLTGVSVTMAVLLPASTAFAAVPEKDQTVYVNADENGNLQNVIVSNWLKNIGMDTQLTDKSNLKNIKNVKGDEEFTTDGNQVITWDANGKDIYYQGESDQELPVGVKVTYYYEGQEIQPSELAGKSGKVKIRIDYTNKAKNGDVYTPFMMLSAMILPSDHFSNVEIVNGKVLSDGNNNIVVGYGFPGLAESLDMEDEKFPDYVEVTADATDFTLSMTATVATTGLLKDLGLADVASADELTDSMNELLDVSEELVKGTGELKAGITTLDQSTTTFVEGLKKADDGTGELKAGIDLMNEKKSDLLTGVHSLVDGSGALNLGALKLQKGIQDYTNGATTISNGISQTAEGSKKLNDGLVQLDQSKKPFMDGIQSATDGSTKLVEGSKALENGIVAYTDGSDKLRLGLQQLNEQLQNNAGTLEQIPTILETLSGGAQKVSKGAEAVENSSASLQAQVQALAKAAGGVSQGAGMAAKLLESQNTGLKEQALSLIKEENVAVNAKANEQQKANVAAALDAAGLTEEQKQAVLSQLGNIQVGVQTNAEQSMQLQGEVKTKLQGIEAQMTEVQTQLEKTDLSDAEAKIGELTVGAKQLSEGSKQFEQALKKSDKLETMLKALEKGVSDLSVGSETLCKQNDALKNGATELTKGTQKLESGLQMLAGGGTQLNDGIQKLVIGSGDLQNGMLQLQDGSTKLVSNNTMLCNGSLELADGMGRLATGSQQLGKGAELLGTGIGSLAEGVSTLKDGTGALANGGVKLKEGTTKLKDGSEKLADGMSRFHRDGIQKLYDTLNGDLKVLLDRLNAVEDADREYTAFDGANENSNGKVKFIIETSGIEK